MALAFDASSETTGTTTFSWTHTPVGTPRGVFVFIVTQTDTADVISGVTYGGVTMDRQQHAADAVGEAGACYGYFLGESVPTGAQTVEVTVSSGSNAKWACAITVTAAADTELAGIGSAKLEGDSTNSSVTITGIAGASYGAAGMFWGGGIVGSVVEGTGMTMRQTHDFGDVTGFAMSRSSQLASGDMTMAFDTSGDTDDTAMVGIAIQEAASSSIKTINGLANASIKTRNGLARASVKTVNGLA